MSDNTLVTHKLESFYYDKHALSELDRLCKDPETLMQLIDTECAKHVDQFTMVVGIVEYALLKNKTLSWQPEVNRRIELHDYGICHYVRSHSYGDFDYRNPDYIAKAISDSIKKRLNSFKMNGISVSVSAQTIRNSRSYNSLVSDKPYAIERFFFSVIVSDQCVNSVKQRIPLPDNLVVANHEMVFMMYHDKATDFFAERVLTRVEKLGIIYTAVMPRLLSFGEIVIRGDGIGASTQSRLMLRWKDIGVKSPDNRCGFAKALAIYMAKRNPNLAIELDEVNDYGTYYPAIIMASKSKKNGKPAIDDW